MMLIGILIVVFAFALAFANGANDNSKGVATLIGGGILSSKRAVLFAGLATLLGSVAAIWYGAELASKFKGKGIVDAAILSSALFPLCVAIASSTTVLLATRIGMPISTTHALVGSIIGIGLAGNGLNWNAVWSKFFYPLLAAPLTAVGVSIVAYAIFRKIRINMGITDQTCLCLGEVDHPVAINHDGTASFTETGLELTLDQKSNCVRRYEGDVFGIDAQAIVNRLHLLSAGAISFARGLNDTPKIAALLIGLSFLTDRNAVALVGAGILAGGLLMVRRVSQTMSSGITTMNDGQAFSANLTTAFLVIFASRWGLPVSTTHVTCGSLFGIGLLTKQGDSKVIGSIVLAWITTLPIAGVIGALCWVLFTR
ncbi:MAG: inorganic phosphate transporter [Verrucomicrobiales bacterium]|nr:inorganic phosphate transporter [Verrucomicrobiales bacterium]